MNRCVALLIMFLCLACAGRAYSQDDSEVIKAEPEEEMTEEQGVEGAAQLSAIYIPLKPEFVVNFGGVGKSKYLKADVTLRLADSKAASSVRHHMPYIRNNLVLLFAAQNDASLESQEGREMMRQHALTEVRELLKSEDGLPPESVIDVLFNALTWHG